MLSSYLIKNLKILDVFSGKYYDKDIFVEDGIISSIEDNIPVSYTHLDVYKRQTRRRIRVFFLFLI